MGTIEQGLILMLIGVSVVFIFLILLVIITKLLSFIVLRYFPEKEKPAARPPAPQAGNQDAEIAAAIAAAAAYTKR